MDHEPITILIVDDDDALRESMARALAKHGFAVLEAGDGFAARRAFTDAAGKVSLVIMDLVLPGIEGREAANLLLARSPVLRILFTSGYTSQESSRVGGVPEGHAFIRKPFEIPQLIETVRKILSGHD
jgi:DNA-binding response OmpR family regulator